MAARFGAMVALELAAFILWVKEDLVGVTTHV